MYSIANRGGLVTHSYRVKCFFNIVLNLISVHNGHIYQYSGPIPHMFFFNLESTASNQSAWENRLSQKVHI